MAIDQSTPKRSFADALQAVPRPVIFTILVVFATIPLFFSSLVKLPNKPIPSSIDFYGQTMLLPDGCKVILISDWTNSTRGETKGEMEALLKLLMRKHIKFVLLSIGDTQAPQVAKDTIREVNDLEAKHGIAPYKEFQDFVNLGFYAAGEGAMVTLNDNFPAIAKGKKDFPEGLGPQDALASPVLRGVTSVTDFKMLFQVTASSTNRTVLERVTRIPKMFMVTGVMNPENTNYYSTGQLKGMCGGVKGVYDLETLMDVGINVPGPHEVKSDKYGVVPASPAPDNPGKGTAYYLALHFTLSLLIIAVVVGNIGMFLSRRRPN